MSTTENQLVVYPNPGSNYIFISNIPVNTTIFIYNMLGNKVKAKIPASTTEQVDISDLASGIYIIRISGKQYETEIRFIKL
jgi:hypothetical protein